jgi:hypothetical protein
VRASILKHRAGHDVAQHRETLVKKWHSEDMAVKPRYVLFAIVVAALVCACASSGPKVRSEAAPGADFSKYRTFGFYPAVSGQDAAYSTFIAQYLREAISREMQSRGYRLAENPDLLLNFNVLAKDKVSVTQSPGGYYGYRRGLYGAWGGAYQTDVRQYTEGTLNVDVVDSAARQLLWEGVAVGQIREEALKNPQPAIDSVISQIFATFPGRAPVATTGL